MAEGVERYNHQPNRYHIQLRHKPHDGPHADLFAPSRGKLCPSEFEATTETAPNGDGPTEAKRARLCRADVPYIAQDGATASGVCDGNDNPESGDTAKNSVLPKWERVALGRSLARGLTTGDGTDAGDATGDAGLKAKGVVVLAPLEPIYSEHRGKVTAQPQCRGRQSTFEALETVAVDTGASACGAGGGGLLSVRCAWHPGPAMPGLTSLS